MKSKKMGWPFSMIYSKHMTLSITTFSGPNYVFSGKTGLFVWSNLTIRKQCVINNYVESLDRRLSCGAPQDSILVFLFFLLYINDMNSTALNIKISFFFADHTSLVASLNKTIEVGNFSVDVRSSHD